MITQLQEHRGRMAILKGWVGEVVKSYDGSGNLDIKNLKTMGGKDVSALDTPAKLERYRSWDAEMNDLQPRIDTLAKIEQAAQDAKRGTVEKQAGTKQAPQSESIGEIIINSKAFKAFLADGSHTRSEEAIGLKADFLRSGGYSPESLRTGLVVPAAFEPPNVIDTIPPGATNMAVIRFMEQTTRTVAAAERAEAAVYAESAFAYTQRSQNVQTIGHLVPVSDEVLADTPTVRSLLDQDMRGGLRERLSDRMIVGNGTSPNILGMFNATGKSTQTDKTASVTVLDYLYVCSENVRTTGWANPNVFYMRSANWMSVRLAKETGGAYLMGRPDEGSPTRIWGMLPVLTNAIAANHVMTVDTAFVQLFTRQGVDVQVGYRGDEFGEGMQTIRAGLRVAQIIKRGAAIAEGGGLDN